MTGHDLRTQSFHDLPFLSEGIEILRYVLKLSDMSRVSPGSQL